MKTNNKAGFTLIELLIVVVIIGILAAIAIPKFANTKDKAYMAAMKTDLRNLATAQEGYFSDNQQYFTGTATQAAPVQGYAPSPNVTVTISSTAVRTGWNGSAAHSALSGKTCTIGVGTGSNVATNGGDGVVKCS